MKDHVGKIRVPIIGGSWASRQMMEWLDGAKILSLHPPFPSLLTCVSHCAEIPRFTKYKDSGQMKARKINEN